MFRDRTRLDVSGSYKESFANMADGLYVKIVNSGRRPITLYALVFYGEDGKHHKFKITNSINERKDSLFEGRDNRHPSLSESQFFEFLLDSQNFDFGPIELESIKSIKVETSTGNLKEIKGLSKEVNQNAAHLK